MDEAAWLNQFNARGLDALRTMRLVYALAQWLEPRTGLDPLVPLVLAVFEGGTENLRNPRRQWYNLWGVKGEYGPQLSRAGAELVGDARIQVPRDLFYVGSSGNRWRAYPSLVHSVVDIGRMLSSGRYQVTRQARPGQFRAAQQLALVAQSGYHPEPRSWVARTWRVLEGLQPGSVPPEWLEVSRQWAPG